jgi:DNA-nicking Smr family endonuclease
MKRRTTDDERKEFEQDFREARPIKPVAAKRAAKKKSASAEPSGINGGTQDRLRKGLLEPDAKLDLHGMTEAAAYRALSRFLNGGAAARQPADPGGDRQGQSPQGTKTPAGWSRRMACSSRWCRAG